jgi:hypothetical protein
MTVKTGHFHTIRVKVSIDAKEPPLGSGRGNLSSRSVIGAIAVVVIGVVVYFLSQPREGTVEWHKREYLKALERLSQNTWKDKLQRVYRRVVRRPQPLGESGRFLSDFIAVERHLDSLVRLGYLQRERVSLTNPHTRSVIRAGYLGRDADEAMRRFISIREVGRGVIRIIAPPSELPKIEAAIRKADDEARHSKIWQGSIGDALVPEIQ